MMILTITPSCHSINWWYSTHWSTSWLAGVPSWRLPPPCHRPLQGLIRGFSTSRQCFQLIFGNWNKYNIATSPTRIRCSLGGASHRGDRLGPSTFTISHSVRIQMWEIFLVQLSESGDACVFYCKLGLLVMDMVLIDDSRSSWVWLFLFESDRDRQIQRKKER